MAATTSRGRSGAITGINVTPLVDITLVLLIVFMVTAKLIVNNKGLPIDLPKAATGGEVRGAQRRARSTVGHAGQRRHALQR
jgi:biopolymer transport protein ExbD